MRTVSNVFRGIKLAIGGIVLAVAGVFVGAGVIHSHTVALPPISKARFEIQTNSLLYLTDNVTQSNGLTTISGYWTESGTAGKWTYSKGTLTFSPALYGPVQIEPREGN
jgi:uncharacterized membrane protein